MILQISCWDKQSSSTLTMTYACTLILLLFGGAYCWYGLISWSWEVTSRPSMAFASLNVEVVYLFILRFSWISGTLSLILFFFVLFSLFVSCFIYNFWFVVSAVFELFNSCLHFFIELFFFRFYCSFCNVFFLFFISYCFCFGLL